MSKPRSKTIDAHAALVYEVLPDEGQPPMLVSRLAQLVPLTMPQVSTALQRLKRDGQAWNPNGRKTKYWARGCAPAPEPTPEPLRPEDDPRQLALDFDLAEVVVNESPSITRAEFDRVLELLEAIAWNLGVDPRQEES